MEIVFQIFQDIFPFIVTHRYWFLFFGAVIESLNSLVLGGFLVSIGAVKIIPIFIIFVVGDFINGFLWYFVGYFAGAAPVDNWLRSKEKSRKLLEKVEEYFHRYSGRTIVITKFTFSFTIATLIMAGSLKYDMKRFALYNLIGSIGWVIFTMAIGFFFGQSYQFLITYIQNITFLGIFLFAAIMFIYAIKNAAKSAFIQSLLFQERLKEMGEKVRESIDKLLAGKSDDK